MVRCRTLFLDNSEHFNHPGRGSSEVATDWKLCSLVWKIFSVFYATAKKQHKLYLVFMEASIKDVSCLQKAPLGDSNRWIAIFCGFFGA